MAVRSLVNIARKALPERLKKMSEGFFPNILVSEMSDCFFPNNFSDGLQNTCLLTYLFTLSKTEQTLVSRCYKNM